MNNITILQQPRPLISIPLISVTPRPLNERLWALVAKEQDGTATAEENRELDRLCQALESEQDL